MQAIVAEKGNQAQKLAAPFKHKKRGNHIEISPCDTFPQGAFLTWCSGHLFEMVGPDELNPQYKKWKLDTLPIIPETFKYKVIKEKAKRYQAVKEVLLNPKVKEIIAAGDPGREGELIVELVIQQSGVKKPVKRVWAQSLEKKAVKRAFENLIDIEETRPLYFEALARSHADWLVGMNMSRAYTLLIQQNGGSRSVYSAGRVQTPTLAMIVNREKEILSFESKPFYEVIGQFRFENKVFEGKYQTEDNESRLFQKELAEKIKEETSGKEARIEKVKKETKKEPPPQFFKLSTLQETANKIFKFSAKRTLDLAQSLYEKSLISYPRTNSEFISEEEARSFPQFLQQVKQLEPYRDIASNIQRDVMKDRRYVNAKKVTDHYAIIPTENVPSLHELSADERKIYDLIVKRVIAAHYYPAEFYHTLIVTRVETHLFYTKGKQMIKEGWRSTLQKSQKKDERDVYLPVLQENETGLCARSEVKEGKTTPPKRYTEGELISSMANAGRKIEDQQLKAVLKETRGLGEEATRAGIIERLKALSYIRQEKHRIIPTEKAFILVEAVNGTVLASAELTARWEQRLSEIGQGKADAKAFIDNAKKLSDKLVKDAINHSSSWDISESIEALDNRENSVSLGQCPKCGAGVVDKTKLYGCSAYNKNGCDFIVSKRLLGKKISETNIKKLLSSGKTNLIKGFKGKSEFNAYLTWKEKSQGTITFQFEKQKRKQHVN
ncbi:DNA topoisomerase 3 [Bacillus sp. FJAT-44742]|uniref:DNA topoisomerase 3 n=1 Tax=Bacillus sp. FJAT-44742 TaxID=2014005 RepID=UPI000C2462A4|nr:DNA topoisomerase 3 [Bacillus sp. FJAT-44742]